MILDLIEKNKSITQRDLSDSLGVAVSMINNYLDIYEKKGHIRRKKYSAKNVEYFITKKGKIRIKLLNIWYLKSAHEVYLSAKNNIIKFIEQIICKGIKRIILYGAGEVSEIMLQVIVNNHKLPLDVICVIDDSKDKIGNQILNLPIIAITELNRYNHDCILISSYRHQNIIYQKLIDIDYPKKNILHFFGNE